MLVFDGKVAQIYLNKLQCDSWCIYAGGGNFTVDDVLICVKRLQSVIMLNQPENVSEPDSGKRYIDMNMNNINSCLDTNKCKQPIKDQNGKSQHLRYQRYIRNVNSLRRQRLVRALLEVV